MTMTTLTVHWVGKTHELQEPLATDLSTCLAECTKYALLEGSICNGYKSWGSNYKLASAHQSLQTNIGD